MIENAALESILTTATDLSFVAELYSSDGVPNASGFDPVDAIDCYSSAGGITFRTRAYKRLVKSFGTIKRTITQEVNTASVTFSNVTREVSEFEFTTGFEGLILVIRLISRSRSIALADSQILFTGRCDKPLSGDKDAITVKAQFILGALDVTIPRRKFQVEDPEGRPSSDPEFEGFLIMPTSGTGDTAAIRVARGGLAGFFGLHHQIHITAQWSSRSDLDVGRSVPEILGRAQILGTLLDYADVGVATRIRVAFCEGPIYSIGSPRSLDYHYPLSATSYSPHLGLLGAANGPDDPSWVAPGLYSHTAYFRGQADNGSVADDDPPPSVVTIIMGRLMTIPDGSGDWVTADQWSDNAAAHVYFLLTDPKYYNLDPAWIDEEYATECYRFNDELIWNRSISDFTYIPEG
jgi:hypothetical protein